MNRIMTAHEKRRIARDIGATPSEIDRELRSFARSAKFFSSSRPRLIEVYPKQWVGVHKGKVRASAKSLRGVMLALKRAGVPPGEALVRYIDTKRRKLIL